MEPEAKEQKIESGRYVEAIGRRKTAVARVRLYPAKDKKEALTINGRDTAHYFPTEETRAMAQEAFSKVKADGAYSVSALIRGGGMDAHAQALRHGIARALASLDEEWKRKLKKAGILKHDPRQKERKKFGKKKARKSPQWSKR